MKIDKNLSKKEQVRALGIFTCGILTFNELEQALNKANNIKRENIFVILSEVGSGFYDETTDYNDNDNVLREINMLSKHNRKTFWAIDCDGIVCCSIKDFLKNEITIPRNYKINSVARKTYIKNELSVLGD